MLSNYFLHHFEAVVAELQTIWLQQLTLVNEVLLSANFLVFVAVTVLRSLENLSRR